MLSLPKILFVLAVIAVVALLSKSFRGQAVRDDENAENAETGQKNQALDLSQCAVCGNFVAPDSRGCERADCPLAN